MIPSDADKIQFKPIKILMVVPKYPFPVIGGLERQAYELSKVLVDLGHKVTVISGLFTENQKKIELLDGVEVRRISWIETPRWLRFLVTPVHLIRLVFQLRDKVDVVHVHNISWYGAITTILAKIFRLPVITKLPNFGGDGIPGLQKRRFGKLRISPLKLSDAIVSLTDKSAKELDGIGYSQKKVLSVYNGISWIPDISAGPDKDSTHSIKVIFVGRLMPQKGLVDLLYAWAQLKKEISSTLILRIIGQGPQLKELKELSKDLNIDNSVNFVGFVDDTNSELLNADISVLASYEEGNSNAILEAMRAGLPIVASRTGGAPVQVGALGERYLFNAGDRQTLVDCLKILIQSESIRKELGAEMRRRVENTFNIDTLAITYEDAYRLLLAGDSSKMNTLTPSILLKLSNENLCAE